MKQSGRMEKKVTLVEFYDHECLENIVSLLHREYPAVTYVYFRYANEPTPEERERLSRFVRKKFGISPQFLEIPENTIASAVEKFRGLIADGGVYDFDITGGSSVFIAAAGVLLAEAGQERVRIHEYDVAKGCCKFSSVERDEGIERQKAEELTFSELMYLRGIQILNGGSSIRYELNRELRTEILRLWETIRSKLPAWNTLSMRPTKYISTWTGLRVEKQMSAHQYSHLKALLDRMSRTGIISDLKKWDQRDGVCVSYDLNVPESAHVLYQKGGNLLELLTYLAAEDSGEFKDCCTGIELDWDDRDLHGVSDPFNELDVVMTHGYIPYFVSCKNTQVAKEYLYEIMTMTRHFGGIYAVPAVVSTVKSVPAVRARAQEMGIVLIDGICEMTMEQFGKKLLKAMSR